MGQRAAHNVQIDALCTLGEVASEEIEEGLHLRVERLLRGGVLDRRDEPRDLIAHRLGCDARGGSLEVDVAGAADTGVEGVAAGHE